MRYYLLLLILLICGCSSDNSEQPTSIHLVEHESQTISLSELFKPLDRMELSFDFEFSEIRKIIKIENFYILHVDGNSAVVKLTLDGKFIEKIEAFKSPEGGLGDITSMTHFGNEIYVLDRDFRRVTVLDYNLKILQIMTLPFYAQSFQMVSDDKGYFYTGNEISERTKGKIVLYDFKKDEILADELEISNSQRKYFNFLTRNHFFIKNEQLYFWESGLETVFALNNQEISPSYRMDLGSQAVPVDFYENNSFPNAYEFVTHMRKQQYSYRPFKIISTGDYLYVLFEHKGTFWASVYNFRTKKGKAFRDIYDDIYSQQSLENTFLELFIPAEGLKTAVIHISPEYFSETDKTNGLLIFGEYK